MPKFEQPPIMSGEELKKREEAELMQKDIKKSEEEPSVSGEIEVPGELREAEEEKQPGMVKVERSSGEKESDWNFRGVLGERVLVEKKDPKTGRPLIKRIPVDDFLELNFKGSEVTVERSSGEKESNWSFRGVLGERVLVEKKDPKTGRPLIKRIPIEDFIKLNLEKE